MTMTGLTISGGGSGGGGIDSSSFLAPKNYCPSPVRISKSW
jgi:hypothetical protein